jgi:hypothetical protein
MAWFRNHYRCYKCRSEWNDDWSCMCDDECPVCGARDVTPLDSDDLTEVVEDRAHTFVVLRSPESAEHTPDYEEVAKLPTRELAVSYLRDRAESDRRLLPHSRKL